MSLLRRNALIANDIHLSSRKPAQTAPTRLETAAVLPRIHKMRKNSGRSIIPVILLFLLFLLFLYEIISRRYRVLRGNPEPPAVRRSRKQRDRTLFLRRFRWFRSRDTEVHERHRHRLWSW